MGNRLDCCSNTTFSPPEPMPYAVQRRMQNQQHSVMRSTSTGVKLLGAAALR